jgi:streptomycin 6-kinase
VIEVPEELAAAHLKHTGESSVPWIAALPELAASYLDRWQLTVAGEPDHGWVSLVLPVLQPDGTPAALKLQPVNEENAGEPVGLRAWDGDGAVRLLNEDPSTGTMLLERLDAERPLSTVPDDMAAVQILAEILARLVAFPAPAELRRLADIAREMIEQVPRAVAALSDQDDRKLLETCAAAVGEVLGEPGDRLLHWDLHYDNILAGDREPWLAIDPKPLAGDPGFDLLPALDNRWDDIIATGDIPRAVRRRFDLLTEVLGLDRQCATRWTLGRVLQNCLWDIEDGETVLHPMQTSIAQALLSR